MWGRDSFDGNVGDFLNWELSGNRSFADGLKCRIVIGMVAKAGRLG